MKSTLCLAAGDLNCDCGQLLWVRLCICVSRRDSTCAYGAGFVYADSPSVCQCLAVGIFVSLPPHCPQSEYCAAWAQGGIGEHYSLLVEMSNMMVLLWKDAQEILSYFFFYPLILTFANSSLHPPLFSTTIKSTCQFLGLRQEEVWAPSMHHWGAAAGCLDICQSGGAFSNYNSHTIAPTHPKPPNTHAHTLFILIHAHTHTHV